MQSKQAFILVTLIGAVALLTCLMAFLSLEFLHTANYSVMTTTEEKSDVAASQVPALSTLIQGTNIDIVEFDKHGQITRIVYSSNLKDEVADFSLLAVPQTGYTGQVFVQSLQDISTDTVILYPLDVMTGKIAAATIKTVGQNAIPSPDQTKVAVINTAKSVTTVTIFNLLNGQTLETWTVEDDKFTTWTNNSCFEEKYCIK